MEEQVFRGSQDASNSDLLKEKSGELRYDMAEDVGADDDDDTVGQIQIVLKQLGASKGNVASDEQYHASHYAGEDIIESEGQAFHRRSLFPFYKDEMDRGRIASYLERMTNLFGNTVFQLDRMPLETPHNLAAVWPCETRTAKRAWLTPENEVMPGYM